MVRPCCPATVERHTGIGRQGPGDRDLAVRKTRLLFITTDGFRFHSPLHAVELGSRPTDWASPGCTRGSKRKYLRSAEFDLRQSIVRWRSKRLSSLLAPWPPDARVALLHARSVR